MKQDRLLSHPDRIRSYFGSELPVLIIVTISGLIYNIGMLAGPYYEGRLAQCLYDIIHRKASAHDMLLLAIVYLLVIALVQISRAIKRFSVRRFANNISRKMRRSLYNSLVHADSKELRNENLGSLLTKAIADVDTCSEGMRKFTTEVFDTGVVMIAYVVMLVHYDWRLTILACLFTPLAYMAAAMMKNRVTKASAAYKQSASNLSSLTMDRISHAITYRVYGREENRNRNYERALQDYERKSAIANLYEGALAPLYDAIAMIGCAIVIYFGARNVNGSGWSAWNIAAFTTFLSCFTKLAVKASHAAKLFNAVQKAAVSWKRIKPLMKEPAEDNTDLQEIPVEKAELAFHDVSLGYDHALLNHISFSAEPGQIIGITGEVASGKSLLGKVLIGEADYRGSITINGREFKDLTPIQRNTLITYMGHDPELLSTNLADNIALGEKLDPDIYLKMTSLDKDLEDMHRTKNDSAGEAGSMLSGGQQARLALARTLGHARSILVLDDPFSAVDRNVENEILDRIRKTYPDRTILLISHRLYHFPQFDRVLYLHNGTATFLDHEDMMKKEPGYRNLYEMQTGKNKANQKARKREPDIRDTKTMQEEKTGGDGHAE